MELCALNTGQHHLFGFNLHTLVMVSPQGSPSTLWDARQLTQLLDLKVAFGSRTPPFLPMIAPDQCLTKIEVVAVGQTLPMDALSGVLPGSALMGLSGLRELGLLHMGLKQDHLTTAWTASLPRLTLLDLTANLISLVPQSLRALSRLQTLNLGGNTHLQLAEDGVDTLAGLPDLRLLALGKQTPLLEGINAASVGTWSDKSVDSILRLKCRKPRLEVLF